MLMSRRDVAVTSSFQDYDKLIQEVMPCCKLWWHANTDDYVV